MQKAILALSKNTSLIEQIRSNLEEGGRFYVQGVTSAHSALAMVRHRFFDLAILDLGQSDLTAAQLIYNLKKIHPGIKVVVYDPSSIANPMELSDLPLDGVLRKPFFAPELSDLLKTFFVSAPSEEINPKTEPFVKNISNLWLQNSEGNLEEISRLLSKTSASSAMVFLKGHLLSQSAGLSSTITQRVVDFIGNQWSTFKGCDICRFMRGSDEFGPWLVYVLPLNGELMLVFTYPINVELRRIRQETSKVRDAYIIQRYSSPDGKKTITPHSMAQLIAESGLRKSADALSNQTDSELAPDLAVTGESQWISEFESADKLANTVPEEDLLLAQPVEQTQTHESELNPPADEQVKGFNDTAAAATEEPVTQADPFSDTQPIPILHSQAGHEPTSVETPPPLETLENDTPSSHAGVEVLPPETSAAIEENEAPSQAQEPPAVPIEPGFTPPQEVTAGSPASETLEPRPEAELMADLENQGALREPLCIYHCVIIPRNPKQFLTRELGEQAAKVIRQQHQTQGWELSRLTIRPQYALWAVGLPFSVDPVKVVEKIKEVTSEQLKSNFPDQLLELEGDNFWSAGYWILSGHQAPSRSLITQFLKINSQKSAEKNSHH